MSILPGPVGQVVRGVGKLLVLAFMVIYVISPIDLMPEALLGPLGIIDDLVVVIFGASFLGFDFLKTAKKTRARFRERMK